MTKPTRLTPDQIDTELAALTGWRLGEDRDSIVRTFEFDGFAAAFAFMTQVALAAEKLDHHPDWRNVYATVEIALSTHDAGGVTARDIALARTIDRIDAATAASRRTRRGS
ncbi:MAG: 4a-hydroxytetrahydrobiopterin dehydratase [Lautropia sp.]